MLPHIVTITDDGLYYRPPYQPFWDKQPFSFHEQIDSNSTRSWWTTGEEGVQVGSSDRNGDIGGARHAGYLLPIST
eukprot:5154317-Ditylum_brightwellii.AAC.1